jgi:cytochrome c oxidase subunit III
VRRLGAGVSPTSREDISRTAGWWAMLLGVMTLATVSMALWFAYLYLRFVAEEWPPAGVTPPDLTWPAVGIALLLVSAAPMHLAVARVRAGDIGLMRLGVVAALLLGSVALGGQVVEYLAADFALDSHSYGSLFFVVGGFHSILLAVGLFMLLLLLLWSLLGYFDEVHHEPVTAVSLYWYFVAGVWVPTGLIVYLSPHLF